MLAIDHSRNLEEEYFHKHNQELLEKLRLKDEIVNLVCPKCQGHMKEIIFSSVPVDKCRDCGGIFFDAGEVDEVIENQQPRGVWGILRSYF